MQLLGLALYSRDGRRRLVRFEPGRLNIVTGESRTGKSALLTITEYCLGRNKFLVPAGPISNTVGWFGSLWQLTEDPSGARAFVGRPAPVGTSASTSRAMLEFGAANLDFPETDDLRENADTDGVRRQLGRRIGIEENIVESRGTGMNQTPFEAHLGHAAWLCLQDQDEIASKSILFHRQSDPKVAEHLKDTLPYFLGAVQSDMAAKQAALRDAQRSLKRAESALATAMTQVEAVDTTLRGLLAEAHAAGLTDRNDLTDRGEIVAALHLARRTPQADSDVGTGPSEQQDRRRELVARRDDVREQLETTMESRSLLLERQDTEKDYTEAVALHAGRLTSLDLIPGGTEQNNEHSACPLCGETSQTPDPAVEDLQIRLAELRIQLTALQTAPPSRKNAITRLEDEADRLKNDLAAVETSLEALESADVLTHANSNAQRNYTRGRVDAFLSVIDTGADSSIVRLQNAAATARENVTRLADEIGTADTREQLHSRLNVISSDMTAYARRLDVEHVEGNVRLDLANLTVVTDTSNGPLPLARIGSGSNWVGYHLATHLALHKFFTEKNRPVPRFLMLDQPTQTYYPTDTAKNEGQVMDKDHSAVVSMFAIMNEVVEQLAPKFQIIVSDHADLKTEQWFQDAIKHEWRGGEKLVPTEWITQDQ